MSFGQSSLKIFYNLFKGKTQKTNFLNIDYLFQFLNNKYRF